MKKNHVRLLRPWKNRERKEKRNRGEKLRKIVKNIKERKKALDCEEM